MPKSNSNQSSKILRFLTRPFFMAVYLWCLVGIGIYIVLDFLLMPLIAGKFKETVAVPQIVGLPPEEAGSKLKNIGLQLMLDSTGDYSAEIEAGKILSQYPQAETVVKEGRRVWVKISKGSKSQNLPVMKGLSLRQAEITLQQLGLKVGQVKHIRHGSIPRGAVIGSSPEAGAPVVKGRSVNVYVSAGRSASARALPNLVGLSLSQAKSKLGELGLEVGKIGYRREKKKLPETVLAQSPKAGRPFSGTAVDLVISQ